MDKPTHPSVSHPAGKTPAETQYFLQLPAYPAWANELGHIEAQHILKLIDVGSYIPAKRHAGTDYWVVTASLDRTDFKQPVYPWEILTFDARVTQVWNTSMEAQVTLSAWNFSSDKQRYIATAYLVMVALHPDLQKNPNQKLSVPPLPKLILETEEDKRLAEAADLRRENRKLEAAQTPFIPITKEDVMGEVKQLMTPHEANTFEMVFGGVILGLLQEAGVKAAHQQARGAVVGVRQDRMSFLEPALIGEWLTAQAVVTKTWKSSIEVQVEVHAYSPQTNQTRLIAASYLVFVHLDEQGKPYPVPTWQPKTDSQQQRYEGAEVRRALRLQEETVLKEAVS